MRFSQFKTATVLVTALVFVGCRASNAPSESAGGIKNIDSTEHQESDEKVLVSSDASLEVKAWGFDWSEVPVWISYPSIGNLLPSDVHENREYKWKFGDGISIHPETGGLLGSPPRNGAVPGDQKASNRLMLDPQDDWCCSDTPVSE